MIFLILTVLKKGPNIPEMPGVYVAGDWVGHDEVLADAAVASGSVQRYTF